MVDVLTSLTFELKYQVKLIVHENTTRKYNPTRGIRVESFAVIFFGKNLTVQLPRFCVCVKIQIDAHAEKHMSPSSGVRAALSSWPRALLAGEKYLGVRARSRGMREAAPEKV